MFYEDTDIVPNTFLKPTFTVVSGYEQNILKVSKLELGLDE